MQKSTTPQEEALRKLGAKWSWADITSYHGDITYSFNTRSLIFLQITELEEIGMHLGSVQVRSLGDTPYITVTLEYRPKN